MQEEPASIRRRKEQCGEEAGDHRERGGVMKQLKISEWVVRAKGAGPGLGCARLVSLRSANQNVF